MPEGGVYILIAHFYLVGPALFIATGYITTSHYHGDQDTLAVDIACPIAICIGVIIPYILCKVVPVIKMKPSGANGLGKVVRFLMSEMRIPGFWDAKVRHERTSKARKKEKMKDCWAITCFIIFVSIVPLVYCGLLIAVMTNGDSVYSHNKITMYNGETLFKPKIQDSRALVECRIRMDRGYVGASYAPETIPGHSWSDHVTNKILTPSSNPIYFLRSFAPGSKVYLNLNSTAPVEIYYKRNDSVVKRWEKNPEF